MAAEEGTIRIPQEILDEADDTFQDTTLLTMTLQGRMGHHTLYATDSEEQVTATFDTAFHMALDELFEELWIDDNIVADRIGEATPEAAAKVAVQQMRELSGIRMDSWTEDRFWDLLTENMRKLSDGTGGEE